MVNLWEEEKLRLTRMLYEKVTHGKEKVTYNDILAVKVPVFFEGCIKNQARRFINSENPIRIENRNRYNLDKVEVKKQFYLLKESLIRETYFTKAEIQQLSNFSVNFQFDILVRPLQKLIESIYKSNDSRKKDDIRIIIQGFGENRPFIKKLIDAIENLESESISREEFTAFARAVEQRVYKKIPISAFLEEISALMEFETTISGEEKTTIHSKVLSGMLKERGLHDMVEAFNDEAVKREYWPIDEVENVLERFLLVGPLDSYQPPPKEKDPLGATLQPTFQLESVEKDNTKVETKSKAETISPKDTTSLRLQFEDTDKAQRSKSKSSQFDSVSVSRLTGKSRSSKNTDTFPVERHDIENQPPGPYPELTNMINPKDQKTFIKKIFNKDRLQYIEFIEHLEKQDNWKAAKVIIDEELRNRQINHFSKEAVLLGDIVFSRYFINKNKYAG